MSNIITSRELLMSSVIQTIRIITLFRNMQHLSKCCLKARMFPISSAFPRLTIKTGCQTASHMDRFWDLLNQMLFFSWSKHCKSTNAGARKEHHVILLVRRETNTKSIAAVSFSPPSAFLYVITFYGKQNITVRITLKYLHKSSS